MENYDGKKIIAITARPILWMQDRLGIDARYYAAGGFYTVLTYAVQIGLGLITSILLARYLPREVYGGWRYLLSVVGMIGLFSLPGMGTAMTQAIARGFDGAYRAGMRSIFKWSLLGSFALIIASLLPLAAHTPPVRMALVVLAVFFPFYSICGLYGTLLVAKKDLRRSFVYGAIYRVALALGVVVAIFSTHHLALYVGIVFGVDILSRGIMTVRAKKFLANENKDPDMTPYGKRLTVTLILSMIAEQIDRLVLPSFLGLPGLALYGVATMIPDQTREFAGTVLNLSFPKLSRWQNSGYERGFIMKIFLLLTLLSALGVALYAFLAHPLLRIIFPAYPDAVNLSVVYGLTFVVFPAAVFVNWFQAQRQMKNIAVLNILSSLTQIAASLICIPLWGLWGAVLARAITRGVGLVLVLILFLSSKKTI